MVPADRVSEISLGDEFRNREGDPSAVHRHALSAYRNFRRFCVTEHAALHYRRTSGDVSGSFARLASPARETAIPSDLRCFIIHAPSSQTEICLSSSHRSGMALQERGRRNALPFARFAAIPRKLLGERQSQRKHPLERSSKREFRRSRRYFEDIVY